MPLVLTFTEVTTDYMPDLHLARTKTYLYMYIGMCMCLQVESAAEELKAREEAAVAREAEVSGALEEVLCPAAAGCSDPGVAPIQWAPMPSCTALRR